jgi:hypothetical protein
MSRLTSTFCSLTTAASTRSIASLASRGSLSAAAATPRSAASATAGRRSATVAACAARSTASARLGRAHVSAATAACLACRAATAGSPARPRAVSSAAFPTRRGRAAPAPPPAAQPRVCRGRATSDGTAPTACSLARGGTGRAAAVRRACHSTPAREQALRRGQPWSHASAAGSPLAPAPTRGRRGVAVRACSLHTLRQARRMRARRPRGPLGRRPSQGRRVPRCVCSAQQFPVKPGRQPIPCGRRLQARRRRGPSTALLCRSLIRHAVGAVTLYGLNLNTVRSNPDHCSADTPFLLGLRLPPAHTTTRSHSNQGSASALRHRLAPHVRAQHGRARLQRPWNRQAFSSSPGPAPRRGARRGARALPVAAGAAAPRAQGRRPASNVCCPAAAGPAGGCGPPQHALGHAALRSPFPTAGLQVRTASDVRYKTQPAVCYGFTLTASDRRFKHALDQPYWSTLEGRLYFRLWDALGRPGAHPPCLHVTERHFCAAGQKSAALWDACTTSALLVRHVSLHSQSR